MRSGFIALLGTQVALDAPLWSLGINIVISSALRGCFEPVAYALVADVCTDDQRIAAFGLQRMGTNLGWAIGPALGGVLTLVVPYGVVFYIAAAGMVIAGIVTLDVEDPVRRTAPEASGARRPADVLARRVRRPRAAPVARRHVPVRAAETQMFSTFSIYMTEKLGLSKADVGLLYTFNGAGVLLLQLPALRVIQRFGIGPRCRGRR